MLRRWAKSLVREAAVFAGAHRLRRRTPALYVLTYHRVLPSSDPRWAFEEPGMVVTPATFRNHLRWLRKRFEVVSLGDWVHDRTRRSSERPTCALTFDDGWRDNYEFAFPELVKTGTPATIFLVSDLIGTNSSFWPNRLARLVIHFGVKARTEPSLAWLRNAGALPADFDGAREQTSRVIAGCKRLSDREIAYELDKSESASGLAPPEGPELLDWDQIVEMRDTRLIEFGSHTCTHMRLNESASTDDQKREIVESRTRLERRIGKPIRLFCYPNGDATETARRLVETHYSGAVTTRRGINSADTPPHGLMRIGMHEDITSTERDFLARLSGWV